MMHIPIRNKEAEASNPFGDSDSDDVAPGREQEIEV